MAEIELTGDQLAWLRDLAAGPVTEDRRGNRRAAAILNPLRGATSGRSGPDLVSVEVGADTRTWSLTERGRAELQERG